MPRFGAQEVCFMGLLDSVLGGGPPERSGISAATKALLVVLAAKAAKDYMTHRQQSPQGAGSAQGGGGLGGILGSVLGGGQAGGSGGGGMGTGLDSGRRGTGRRGAGKPAVGPRRSRRARLAGRAVQPQRPRRQD